MPGTALGGTEIAPQAPGFVEVEQKLCLSGSNNYDTSKAWGAESGWEKELFEVEGDET